MTTTNPTLFYVIGAIVLIAIVVGVIVATRRARSERLRRRFGPEYERVARARGDRTEAERELARREERVKKFHLEELPPGARDRYAEEWRGVQARFVDRPKEALAQADALIANVMRDRGYPLADFEQRAADLSPDHAGAVGDYRAAHAVALRSERDTAETEDLRQAMLHYRAIFEELVENKESVRS